MTIFFAPGALEVAADRGHSREAVAAARAFEVVADAAARKRILRHLGKHGLLDDDGTTDPLSEQAPLFATCYATSIAQRQTLGPQPGTPFTRIGRDPSAKWKERAGVLQAHLGGFDLHAKVPTRLVLH
ncbi:MAG TPA: hypothetical protein VF331_17980 [Polyangiales bacterium]